MLTAKLFALAMTGALDRARGDGQFRILNKTVECFLYGIAIALCIGSDIQWTIPVFAALWTIGGSFGWGTPIGAALRDEPMDQNDLEWWQFGVLKESVTYALLFRGFMWAALPMCLAYFDPKYLSASVMIIAFPAAIRLSKRFWTDADKWAGQEWIRGYIVGLFCFLIGLN